MVKTAPKLVLDFFLSFFVVGLVLLLFKGILDVFRPLSETGANFDLAMFFWFGFPIAFSILAIFYLYYGIKEWKFFSRRF